MYLLPRHQVVRSRLRELALLVIALVALGCHRAHPEGDRARPELLVFAAASLRDVLGQLQPELEQAAGAHIVYNFGGSGELAQQIEATHKADVFLSASEDWVSRLQDKGLIVPGTRRTFLSNRLVIIASGPEPKALSSPLDLATVPFATLSLANPETVPAGQYAKQLLSGIPYQGGTLWDRVKDRVAPASDVRGALAVVEAKEDALGIVYRTDALTSKKVRVLYEVSGPSVPKIRYVGAALSGRPDVGRASSFVAYLTDPKAMAVFAKAGFVVGQDE